MGNTKKQRALKTRANNNNSTLGQTDSETDGEPLTVKRASPKVAVNSGGKNMLKDFDVQAKTFLENLEMAYKEKKKAIELQHKKIMVKIAPEILELTFEEYLSMRSLDTPQKKRPHSQVAAEEPEHVQSPNITSSQKRDTSTETHKFGETFTTSDTPEPPAADKQVVLRKSIPVHHQNPRVVMTKFDPSKSINPLRWAKDNEIAVSMTGSPLVVPSIPRIPMINLNIPLANGQVMAILPKPMTLLNGCPEMSTDVLQQLERIEENISIVKKLCQQHAPRSLESSSTLARQ